MRVPATRIPCVLVAILALVVVPSVGAAAAQSPTPTQPAACLDFASQEEAQEFFESEGGPEQDPLGLDPNRDGRACDEQPAAGASPVTTSVTGTATPTGTASAWGRIGVPIAVALAGFGSLMYYLWRKRRAQPPPPPEEGPAPLGW